jgi:sulfur-carrier protein
MVHDMSVTVLLFASYADAFGRDTLDLELPAGATVGDLVTHLARQHAGRALPPAPLVAVNAAYAQAEQVLASGDEVAIIPPVAGG